MECSRSIVASQFRVLEFHIGFYIQSSPDAKSSIKCVPGVVSANQTWLHVEAMANLVRCLQNDSTLTRLSQRWLLQRDSGMHWAMLAFPDISGKGGVIGPSWASGFPGQRSQSAPRKMTFT